MASKVSGTIYWHPEKTKTIDNGSYNEKLRDKRIGVMLHFDASGTDEGAMAWFADPRCKVSYHYLVLDDGTYVEIAPETARAWHAGWCAPSNRLLDYSDANSAFYGVAAATNAKETATAKQLLTVAWLTRKLFKKHNWRLGELWRITGHDKEAVYPRGHEKEGQRGRKIDPTGYDPKRPILSLKDVRELVPLIFLR